MVVLAIVMQKNGKNGYFREPLPEENYVRLLSCSFYSSWHNLKETGEITFKENAKREK